MKTPEQTITDLGLTLPPVPKPVAVYIPAVQAGNIVFTSGQLPTKEGVLVLKGIVGAGVEWEAAKGAAEVAALNALAAVKGVIGELSRIERIVKVGVFVASAPDFTDHPKIANGASELIQKIFGDKGVHARTTIGVACLPLNAPVEVELTVQIQA